MSRKNFNIFALMVVKNEEDIIDETILYASKWADKIVIMDNISDDGTWEKLNSLAKKNDKILLWGQYGGRFHDGLRQMIFNDFHHIANENDWWCRLDGDEIYIDNPREFLAKLPSEIDHVYNASFQYYYTEDDYEAERNTKTITLPVTTRLKSHKCNHSEIRFFKHSKKILWPQYHDWPISLFKPCEKRIRLKHYQYRSLEQIRSRLAVRSVFHGNLFCHEKALICDWYKRRGFDIPKNKDYQENRIVLKRNLDSSNSYYYNDNELPQIHTTTFKKHIKCLLFTIYRSLLK